MKHIKTDIHGYNENSHHASALTSGRTRQVVIRLLQESRQIHDSFGGRAIYAMSLNAVRREKMHYFDAMAIIKASEGIDTDSNR